jgi:DNA-binding transcriptional MocR family regulator
MTPWQSRFSPYASRVTPSAIFELTTMPRAPDTINLGPGEPDASMFPVGALTKVLSQTLQTSSVAQRALQYTVNAGYPQLRQKICDYMRTKGVACSVENILVTNGAQQALDLLTELFVRPSTKVVVQAPTYPGALGVFKADGAEVVSIDQHKKSPRDDIALIYATANFHNPTGTSLSLEERRELIALAHMSSTVLVEDDPYETISLDGTPSHSMLSLELHERSIEDAHTIYVSTFSKSAAPGLRVGWVVAPAVIIERLTLLKQSEDLQAGTLAQVAVAGAMDFIMQEHVPRLRDAYRARRDTMLSALIENFGNDVQWTQPAGGFFIWLSLPPEINTSVLLSRAALEGVTYVPGSAFSHDGSFSNALRLSYSSVGTPLISEGVRRLAAVVRGAE